MLNMAVRSETVAIGSDLDSNPGFLQRAISGCLGFVL